MSDVETETDEFTDVTEETESETNTDTTSTFTIETYGTSEEVTDTVTSASESELHLKEEEEEVPQTIYLRPQDLLNLAGRHIKAEDFEWGKCPVLPLSDIIVEAAADIKGPDLEKFLKNATEEQRPRIVELLPLDLPVELTISIIEDGIYWKRQCLRFWPAWDVWRFSDSWKSMFVHRSVQKLIENFVPDKESIADLTKKIEIYSTYVNSIQIRKLMHVKPVKLVIDVDSENFDQQLDDILSDRKKPIYVDFEKIFSVLPDLKKLTIALSARYIDLQELHFNNADFNCLFRALRKLEELEELRMSNGNFSNEQLVEFLKMFQKHKALKVLNLSFNLIKDYECGYIAQLLRSPCPIETLILLDNKITDAGAKAIAAALLVNGNLKKLDLSLNMIGNAGADAVAKVLQKNNSLMYLDLSKNKFTEEGGIAFAELVKKTRTLRILKIQENFLGENGGKEFVNAIKENDRLLEMEVRFCGFRNEDEGLIHRAILQNRSKVPYSTYCENNKDITASEFLF